MERQDSTKEIWVPVVGWRGYSVSNMGRVRSEKREVTRSDRRKQPIPEKMLIGDSSSGYIRIRLRTPSGSKRMSVHRLVAIHFIPNPENKRVVNHINGIRTDNRVTNLEWATNAENISHAYKTGLNVHLRGEDWHNSKLTEAKVKRIRRLYRTGEYTQEALAGDFGVSRRCIGKVVSNNSWTHV